MDNLDHDVADSLHEYLVNLLDIIGERARVEITQLETEEVYINLQGSLQVFGNGDSESVAALSTLLETILQRKFDSSNRVCLDINGRKKEQRQKLQGFAKRAAERAKERYKRIRLNPMPAPERKWIHVTLADVEGVKTYSVGEGAQRRVIVEPTGKDHNDEK